LLKNDEYLFEQVALARQEKRATEFEEHRGDVFSTGADRRVQPMALPPWLKVSRGDLCFAR